MVPHGAAFAVSIVAALLCCIAVEVCGYDSVPIVSIFYVPGASGTRSVDERICMEHGGYLATEATAVLHEADVQRLESEGLTTYYAFLGGAIEQPWHMESNQPGFCPFSNSDPDLWQETSYPQTTGDNNNCYWRWSAGRWGAIPSTSGLPYDVDKNGVIFYRGQTIATFERQTNGFPIFFPMTGSNYYPNVRRGHYLLLFRGITQPDKAVWGDTYARGGFAYGDDFSGQPALVEATLGDWQLLCQSQGPTRLHYELAEIPSQLQELWWLILLVILFVLCLITVLVVVLCQEREDMDEPPEDPPEWAEKEAMQRSVSRRYMSQHSFRFRDDESLSGQDPDDDDENNNNNNNNREYVR